VVEQLASPATVTTQLVDHWGWRPDWEVERPCLMWYLTFEDEPGLSDLAVRAHDRLRSLRTVDLIPAPWLHLTLDDVGFVDTLGADDVDRVVDSVRAVLEDWRSGPITLGPVTTMEDAVVLAAVSPADLGELCGRLRSGTSAVLDRDPGYEPLPFWGHVSLAYTNRPCDAASVLAPLAPLAGETLTVTVSRVTLAAVTRRDRHYQWTVRASLPLVS
jgi:2'-5' RNA ligase